MDESTSDGQRPVPRSIHDIPVANNAVGVVTVFCESSGPSAATGSRQEVLRDKGRRTALRSRRWRWIHSDGTTGSSSCTCRVWPVGPVGHEYRSENRLD